MAEDVSASIESVDLTLRNHLVSDGIELGIKLSKLNYNELGDIYGYDTVAEVMEHFEADEIAARYSAYAVVKVGDVLINNKINTVTDIFEMVVTYVDDTKITGFRRDTGHSILVQAEDLEQFDKTGQQFDLSNMITG